MLLNFLNFVKYRTSRLRNTHTQTHTHTQKTGCAHLAHANESRLESLRVVPLGDGVEYSQHRVLVELVDGDELKVSHEAR